EPSDEAQDECFITWLGVSQMYRWLHAGLFTAEAQRAPRFFLSPQGCTWNRRAVLGDGMPRGGIALPCYAAASWHLEWPALRRLRMPRGNCFTELLQCRCRVCIVMMPLCFSVASVVNRELPASFAPLRCEDSLLPADTVLVRRLRTEQMPDEVVPPAAHHVVVVDAIAMPCVREDQQVEVLVRLDQCVDDQVRVVRRDVVVHAAMGEEELAAEVGGVRLVRDLLVVVARALSDEQAVVALAPVVLVVPVVVVPGLRDADLEEVGVAEHRGRGREPAAGVAPDAGTLDVDERVALGELAHSCDLIGQRVVAHVAVVRVMERLGASGRAHAVDLDDDEAELGECLIVAACG